MSGAGVHRGPVATIRAAACGVQPALSKILGDSCYFNGPQFGAASEAALFVRRVCPVPFAFIT